MGCASINAMGVFSLGYLHVLWLACRLSKIVNRFMLAYICIELAQYQLPMPS